MAPSKSNLRQRFLQDKIRALAAVVILGTATFGSWKELSTPSKLASRPGPQASTNIYSEPHYGLYFFGPNDAEAKAVPGVANPYFDPNKPTLIYVHGWSIGGLPAGDGPGFILTGYPAAPTVDLSAAWRAAGWNVGVTDWMQFADTTFDTNSIGLIPGSKTYDNAQRKIWAPNDEGQLIYHLADGTPLVDPANSVTDIMLKDYIAFMGPIYHGGEVRFHGHSLGAQMAINLAHRLWQTADAAAANGTAFNTAILPSRVAITDLIASNCPQSYLTSTKPRQRIPLLVCPNADAPGDWVGERLLDAVTELKAAPQAVAFEAYRCWLVDSSGVGGDQFGPLYSQLALTELKPNVALQDFNQKHAFCFWNYLWSYAYPPPKVLSTTSGSGNKCALFNPALNAKVPGGPAASLDTATLRTMSLNSMHFVETDGVDGPTPADHVYTCVDP